MTWSTYTSNIYSAVLGNKKETFNTTIPSTPTPTPSTSNVNWTISIPVLLSFLVAVVFCFMYGYGAAKLSYCYNKSLGRSDMEAMLWALIAYIFGGIYYPYYGIFLNPVCAARVPNIVGGRRR